ncbi:MAG TPA: ribosome maturation factor RimP, partial [Acidimicrobiales bacterium]|nr:ribosome maturation factor RimP [Acidimicrobiales bacterium]
VRVLVDRPGGIDLEGCAQASRLLSPLLDDRPDLVPDGSYQLEVSSPGAERTLRTVDHYRRYLGSPIAVKTRVPIDGARRHQGTLVYADETVIRIQTSETGTETSEEVRYDQIERARTVLIWGPAEAGGKRGPSSRPSKASSGPAGTAPAHAVLAAHNPKDPRP